MSLAHDQAQLVWWDARIYINTKEYLSRRLKQTYKESVFYELTRQGIIPKSNKRLSNKQNALVGTTEQDSFEYFKLDHCSVITIFGWSVSLNSSHSVTPWINKQAVSRIIWQHHEHAGRTLLINQCTNKSLSLIWKRWHFHLLFLFLMTEKGVRIHTWCVIILLRSVTVWGLVFWSGLRSV